jgi:dolichol kinase
MACALGGATFSHLLVSHFVRVGAFALWAPGGGVLARVAACAAVGALVESLPLPLEGGDNVTVPAAAALASLLLFGA